MRIFIGGLLLGAALTLVGGAVIGPEITLSNVGSGTYGFQEDQYQLLVTEHEGKMSFAVVDKEKGAAVVIGEDGRSTRVSVNGS